MTNKEIANVFNELARIMELHKENVYKVRSYQNAYITLRKYPDPVSEMSEEELSAIKGIGKAISSKIREISETGTLQTLANYLDKTPPGVVEMLGIKGVGPKKVRALWKDLDVESPGELWYACNENRLIELKGFGAKTQADILKKLEFFQRSKGKHHFATLEESGELLLEDLRHAFPDQRVELAGAFRRKAIVLESLDYLMEANISPDASAFPFEVEGLDSEKVSGYIMDGIGVNVYLTSGEAFGKDWILRTGSAEFVEALQQNLKARENFDSEDSVFDYANLQPVPPEMREGETWLRPRDGTKLPQLITESDIRGLVHCHSTYSDGMNSIAEMADAAQDYGLEYMVLSDHSRSAFYANGLDVDRIHKQWEEIDAYNQEHPDFHIFKSIESDILNDGSLDYPDEVLAGFDCIIASVHSNLKMDKEKATARLLKAIDNKFTTILGHPTGRLLLSREGYPIDHRRIIDACAENGVCIEINAHPFRLDLDWHWIPYAIEQGVMISINPDAHSTSGISDIHYGVLAARKGGLDKAHCINCLDQKGFASFLKK